MVEHALNLDDQIIVAIRRVSQAVEQYSSYLLQRFGLTAPQLGTLRELQKAASATPGQLAEQLHISPATMAGILKRLEQRSLISRVRDEVDRRSSVVRITPEGIQLAESAPSLLRDQFRERLHKLELWERTQLLATLQRTAEMMNADEIEESPFLYHDTPVSSGRAPPADAVEKPPTAPTSSARRTAGVSTSKAK